jgi:hypothetical protein
MNNTATRARLQHYGDGTPDPRTATCPQHRYAAPYSDTARGDDTEVPGRDWPCVVCLMPDADLIGTEVILTSSEGTFMYGGLGERGDAISIKFSLRGMPNIVTCDVSCVAPADTPVDLKDPRINVVKLAKKRGYYDAGFWLPGITYLPDWSPRTTRTKTEATAYCARRVAIDDFHRGRA